MLDRSYVDAGPDRWYQERPRDAGDLVRATLELDGLTLTVETMSEDRMDDIVAELVAAPARCACVVSETIEPIESAAARAAHRTRCREPVDRGVRRLRWPIGWVSWRSGGARSRSRLLAA